MVIGVFSIGRSKHNWKEYIRAVLASLSRCWIFKIFKKAPPNYSRYETYTSHFIRIFFIGALFGPTVVLQKSGIYRGSEQGS